jgi:hypothetical protein
LQDFALTVDRVGLHHLRAFNPFSTSRRGEFFERESSHDASFCHLLAPVENGIVAAKPQEFRPQPPTIRLVTGYVSMRCRMLSIDEDTFTMISGLIVVAVVGIAGLLALG